MAMRMCLQVSRKRRDENENSLQVNLVNLIPDFEESNAKRIIVSIFKTQHNLGGKKFSRCKISSSQGSVIIWKLNSGYMSFVPKSSKLLVLD